MAKDIFRKVALARLSSPEQLDLVMEVTAPQGWIALSGVGVLLMVLVVWGFAGSIPEKVDAAGILLKRGGIFDIAAPSQGQIAEIRVKEGDVVKRGDVVARIAQPEIAQRIANAKAQVQEVEEQLAQARRYNQSERSLREGAGQLQRQRLAEQLKFLEQREKALKEQLDNSEELQKRGLITKQTILQVRDNYYQTQGQAQQARGELRQLEVNEMSFKADRERAENNLELRIADARRQLGMLEGQLQGTSMVTTPYAGKILEMKQAEGSLVGAGTPLLSVQAAEESSEGLQAVVYVPPTKGKSLRPGMEAQVSPSTSKREEYGFIVGKVAVVSEFPATRQGMLLVLPNPDLVASLSGQGAPFAVYVDLLPDPASASGYQWSSSKGNSQKVGSGTLAAVTIVVRERRPIEMVIPLLREYTGI